MENKSFYDQSGRSLSGSEIVHMDNTLLGPASTRCRRYNDDGGHVLRKELRKPVVIQDGVRHYPRFISEMDTETNQWQYKVGLGVIETAAYEQLTIEERHQIQLQYQKVYAYEGEDMTQLVKDETWQRLTAPEEYGNVKVHFSSMQEYAFVGDEAGRSYAINHILTLGHGIRARSLGKLSLHGSLGHWATNIRRSEMPIAEMITHGLIAEEAAALDLTAEDYQSVTTEDVYDVIGILKMLDLVSPNDEKRFGQGLR